MNAGERERALKALQVTFYATISRFYPIVCKVCCLFKKKLTKTVKDEVKGIYNPN